VEHCQFLILRLVPAFFLPTKILHAGIILVINTNKRRWTDEQAERAEEAESGVTQNNFI
jgi:hypothetical protein